MSESKEKAMSECYVHEKIEEGMTEEQAIEALHQWELKQMKEVGWYIHYISIDDTRANYHTHGLEQSFGHPDLQITLPLDQETVQGIFSNIVDDIKRGIKFETDVFYDEILGDEFLVRFITAKENDRTVLRVLIPDKNNSLKEYPFNLQLGE